MKHVTLSIDTSDQEIVRLALILDKKQVKYAFKTGRNLSEFLIPAIEKFLRKYKVKLNQLEKINVMAGPGHFSRIRTSVAVANALVYGLGLKQNIVKPIYDKAPNITRPKFNKVKNHT